MSFTESQGADVGRGRVQHLEPTLLWPGPTLGPAHLRTPAFSWTGPRFPDARAQLRVGPRPRCAQQLDVLSSCLGPEARSTPRRHRSG